MKLNPLRVWLDLHPQVYLWLVGILLVGALVLAVIPFLRKSAVAEAPGHDWWWSLLVVAILAAGRWPSFLVEWEFNPDESQLLAGARVLWHDPVFWRAVDGGTAGPLDFFSLWPTGFVFGWHTYLTTRVAAFLLLALSLVLTHQTLALAVGRRIARVAGLAALSLEALTNSDDLLHYSTELVSIALLAAAGYAAVRRWVRAGGREWNGLGGLLLGAVPLAKLQAVPVAAIFGLAWLVAEFRQQAPDARRRCTYLVAGALLPASLFAFQITLAGEWWNVLVPYYYSNVHYVKHGGQPFWLSLQDLWEYSVKWDSLMHYFVPGALVWILLMARRRLSADRSVRIFLGLAVANFLLAGFCIYYPGRPFLHYWQLLVIPLTLLIGAASANLLTAGTPAWGRPARWLVAVGVVGLTSSLLLHRVRVPNKFFGLLAYFQVPRAELSVFVAARSRPGESIAIWGWSSYVYVEAGLRQATREANFGGNVEPGPFQHYYQSRYLADLAHSRPELFLDSTGPGSLRYHDPKYRFEQIFPELAAIIRERYVLIGTLHDARLYRRRDLPPVIVPGQ